MTSVDVRAVRRRETEAPVVPTSTEPPAGLVAAQAVAKQIAAEAMALVTPGLTEVGWQREVDRIAARHGSSGQWTPATTRVGLGTLVAHPDFPMQERAAADGDTAFLDVTPTVDGWLGDFCVSVVVGTPDPESLAVVEDCRWIQQQMIAAARPGMPASEMFAIGAGLASQRRVKLLDLLDNFGHSIGEEFAADGFIDADNDTPMYGAWTIEPQVGRRARGAKFEDIIWLADGQAVVVI
jgi:Xaa-Pro dipeptidase